MAIHVPQHPGDSSVPDLSDPHGRCRHLWLSYVSSSVACGEHFSHHVSVGNTDEELCNRWMQLSAFTLFYRNHNTYGAIPQEPYRWPSVADASRTAIEIRYTLLPYWVSDACHVGKCATSDQLVRQYTLFANASIAGFPPIRALFYEFPDEPELFAIDRQWLIGRDILVTPVLTPGATTVDGMRPILVQVPSCQLTSMLGVFPGRGGVIWRDWYTHAVVNATSGGNTTLDAPIGHINVHIRDNSALLLHQQPAYTIAETRAGPYSLVVSLSGTGTAFGMAYIDDGISPPPTPNRTVTIQIADGVLAIRTNGTYVVQPRLSTITLLGAAKPSAVMVQGQQVTEWNYTASTEKLVLYDLAIDLGEDTSVSWQ